MLRHDTAHQEGLDEMAGADFRTGGQTVTAFCRERGLCRPYFFLWKKRLREDAATKFLEVQLKEAAPSAARDTRVEIRLQNGRSLVVGRGFDAEHVRALLALVETAS